MDVYTQNNKFNNYVAINNENSYYNTIRESFPDNYENSIINNANYVNMYNMSNTYNNLGSKKFYNNNNNNKDNLNETEKLNFRIIESTTEDIEHPLSELKKGLKGKGWQSSRFSQFPQDIYIQFPQPVFIKRMDLIIHEKNIPSKIKFYSYCPRDNEEIIKNYHQVNYDYVGFIKMDTNERYNYRTRESRKVYINSKSLFLKIQLDKNYINQYNIFNQVGLMNIDFLGGYLPFLGGKKKNNNLMLENSLRRDIKDEDLANICGDKLYKLKELMDFNIKNENYLECKQLKSKIDKVRLYGRKIYDLEAQKKVAVNNEDFDKAMELKDLAEKMKNNLKLLENNPSNKFNNADIFDIDNQIVGNNNLNNISLVPITNNNTINDSGMINEIINDNLMSQFEQFNNNNNNNQSLFNNSNKLNSINNSYNNKSPIKNIDSILNYDETILPSVLNRLNNKQENKPDELDTTEKGELEPISSPGLLLEFNIITNVIKEEGMRKIFSKQILWKKEGLNILIENLGKILEYKEENEKNIINIAITQIMKLSMILIEEKHPLIVNLTLEIIKKLFDYIKYKNINLKIDSKVTESLLIKLKQKLGDVNAKVRDNAVKLYCFMLTLNFCDYNNLISELLEEEFMHYKLKTIMKSNILIMGKLDILISAFNNFSDVINSKRTNLESFPSNLVLDYLIMYVSHNRSEIRKKTRLAISKFIKIFGIPKFKKKIEKIEERELKKLVSEIPELREYFPKLYSASPDELNNSGMELNSNNKGRKNSNSNMKINNLYNLKDNEKKSVSQNKINNNNKKNINIMEEKQEQKNENKNIKNEKNNNNININKVKENSKSIDKKKLHNGFCEYCQRKMNQGEVLANHWISNCKMFTQCEKCYMNLEVQKLNEHRGKECKFKDQYKLCKTCNEYFLKDEFSKHQKEKCSLKRGYKKCPLCHKDIDISNKNSFYIHLVKQGCSQQRRK